MNAPVVPAVAQLAAGSPTAVAAAAVGHALVVVAAPQHVDVAAAVAAILEGTFPDQEVTVAYPETSRWKVDEFHDVVVSRARFAADSHRHLVVADAHAATPQVHDRLLKVLEEQTTNTTVWLTHPDRVTLPSTLRGRAGDQLSLRTADHDTVAATLAATGVDPDLARTLLVHAAGDLTVASAAARFGLLDQLATFAALPPRGTPTTTAADLLLATAHLSVATHHKIKRPPAAPVNAKGTAAAADLSKLSPAARATLRRLVGVKLRQWRDLAVDGCAKATSADARRYASTAVHLSTLEEALVYNTPLMTVLASALVALDTRP